ncbi:hypothetical protein LguiA_026370 [Lonicera macranthoides]
MSVAEFDGVNRSGNHMREKKREVCFGSHSSPKLHTLLSFLMEKNMCFACGHCSELQDVVYDVDDVLDDFMTKDLRCKVVIKGSKRKAVKNFFSSSNSFALCITTSRKLKNIRSRLEDIDADRKQFELLERALGGPVVYPLKEQTHSFARAYDGLIQSSDGSRQLYDIGNQYFHELQSRSFFQYIFKPLSFDNAIINVKMHDLVHNLALSVAGKEVSHVKYDIRNIFEGARHLLFSALRLEGKEFPHFLVKLNKVRSFSFQFIVGPIIKTFLDNLIKTFSCLHTLELSGSKFEELPKFCWYTEASQVFESLE